LHQLPVTVLSNSGLNQNCGAWGTQTRSSFGFESCSSHYVREAYKLMRYQLIALRYRSPISNAVSSHQILVDAIGDGDCDVACAELREHVLENEARYWAACSIRSYSFEQDAVKLGK
jgi:hypothetical protein